MSVQAFLALQQRVQDAQRQLMEAQVEKEALQQQGEDIKLVQQAMSRSFARLHMQLTEERTERVSLLMRARMLQASKELSRAEALEQAGRAALAYELDVMQAEAAALRAEVALLRPAEQQQYVSEQYRELAWAVA